MEPTISSIISRDLIFFILSLFLCAVFSFLETSVAAMRLFKLKELAQASGKYRSLFHTLEHSPNQVLISILIAYNLGAVISTLLSGEITKAISQYFLLSENFAFVFGVLLSLTSLLLVDLIPKSFAIKHGDKIFSSTLWLTNIIYRIFNPFVVLGSKIVKIFSPNAEEKPAVWIQSEKEIEFLIEYINQQGLMEKHKTAMLKSIFELGTTTIKEVMIPDTSIIAVNIASSQKEVLDVFSKYQYTRLPVYEGNLDNIIGMVLQKDFFLILSRNEDRSLRDIVRPIMFIPESTKLLKALKEFREQRLHIAMVINEYGGVSGLVTLEDIIEEIVGEISDEYEAVAEKIIQIRPKGWLIDASVELKELTDILGIEFKTEGALTLGGFLIEQFQHVPQKGEHLEYKNFYFQVQQASPKRVYHVLVFEDKIPDDLEIE